MLTTMADNNGGQQIMNNIPQFTVIKNGSILKNIFLLSKQSTVDKSSQNRESDEEILLVGRHPECHITLEHPSISRYHLRIHSNPSKHTLSVVDLSSVHGTWVSGKRIEPGVHVVLKEGDTVKIGASSRVYELHWVPCSRAYDVGEPFVPAVYTIKEGREEEEEEMNQVVEEKHEEYSSNDDLEGSEVLSSNTVHDSPSKTLNSSTSRNENDDIFATVSIQAPLAVTETTSAAQVSDILNDSEDQLMTNCLKSSCYDPEVEHEEYSLVDNLECLNLSTSSTINDSPMKTSNPLTSGNEINDIFATVSIQSPLVSETSATQVSDGLNESEDQLMTNCPKTSCGDAEGEQSSRMKHEEHPSVDDLECSDLSTSNTINNSPLKTLNPSASCNENSNIFASVSIQAPLVVSETTSATQVSDSLNDSEDQLILNCSTPPFDDAEIKQVSPWKHEVYSLVDDLECLDSSTSNTISNSPLKTLDPLTSCNDIFATVSIQAPLVASQTTSATQVSDSLNDSQNQLMPNCSKSSCVDAELEQSSPRKHEEYPLVDDLECLDLSKPNMIRDSPLKTSSPLTSASEINDIFTTVSIQAPLVSETTSTAQFSDILNDSVDQLMPNSSIPSCDGTEIEQSSPWKTGSGNGEFFTTVCVSEDISVTEMTDYLNKSEDKLNCLSDNLSNDIGQISHATIKDDPVSIDLFNAIETHEKDALNQNIARSNETDIDNENQQKINNGSDDKTHTPDISKAQEIHMNPMSAQKLSASMKLFDSLHGKEMEFYTPDKENKNPNACSGKSLSKKPVNPIVYEETDILGFSQNLFAMDEGLCREQEADAFADSEEVLAISSEKESKSVQTVMEGRCNSMNYPRTVENVVNSSQNLAKKRWTMVVDTNSFLDHKSLKYLKLLEDITGTRLFLTKTVVRELMDIESQDNFFNGSSKKASLALEWIDECMMNTSQWIHMDDDEAVRRSSTALEIALRLREENSDQKIIILSDNLTLKIKAMAEGIMCEAAEEFHKSLVNPFSERFMWVGSSARGLTWSCVDDDDIVRQEYQGFGLNGSHKLKGLKLLACVTTS